MVKFRRKLWLKKRPFSICPLSHIPFMQYLLSIFFSKSQRDFEWTNSMDNFITYIAHVGDESGEEVEEEVEDMVEVEELADEEEDEEITST